MKQMDANAALYSTSHCMITNHEHKSKSKPPWKPQNRINIEEVNKNTHFETRNQKSAVKI